MVYMVGIIVLDLNPRYIPQRRERMTAVSRARPSHEELASYSSLSTFTIAEAISKKSLLFIIPFLLPSRLPILYLMQ